MERLSGLLTWRAPLVSSTSGRWPACRRRAVRRASTWPWSPAGREHTPAVSPPLRNFWHARCVGAHLHTHTHTRLLLIHRRTEIGRKSKKKVAETRKPASSHKSSARLFSFLMQHLMEKPTASPPSITRLPPPPATSHLSIMIIISSFSKTHCSSQNIQPRAKDR